MGVTTRITFATGNPGKIAEAREFLEPLGFEVAQWDGGYPEIQADSLVEVSRWGVQWLRDEIEAPFLLEDAGLFVDALDGFPGVYSSYVFGTLGNEGILRLVEGVDASNRSARFRAVIGFYDGDTVHVFEGVVEGSIGFEPHGTHGFGFDPIFMPEGHDRSFGEMTSEEKGELSHRARALEALVDHLA